LLLEIAGCILAFFLIALLVRIEKEKGHLDLRFSILGAFLVYCNLSCLLVLGRRVLRLFLNLKNGMQRMKQGLEEVVSLRT
jgi:hypothetical protein